MSAITKAEIPDQCNTLERLAAWSLITLARVNPTLRILELDNESPIPAASASTLKASGGESRVLVRGSFALNADWESSTTPIWESVEDLSNVALPPGYLQS